MCYQFSTLGPLGRCLAASESFLDLVMLQVVLPSLLILTFETCEHDLLLWMQSEKLMLSNIQLKSNQRSRSIISHVVDDIATHSVDDCDIVQVHEDNVILGDGKALWCCIKDRLRIAIASHIPNGLQLVSRDEQVACCVKLFLGKAC